MACASSSTPQPMAGKNTTDRPAAESGDNAPYGTNIEGGQGNTPKN